MAVIQQNGLLQYIDENGNVYILYPVTTLDNVSGTGKLLLSEDGKKIKTLDGTEINLSNEESDPTVPEWAKQSEKPSYKWDEISDKPFTDGKLNEECLPDNVGGGSENIYTTEDIVDGVSNLPTGSICFVDGSIKKIYMGDTNGLARLMYSNYPTVESLAVGTSVYMNVNGVRTEFIVVQQYCPDATIYDLSCNGTWLLMKDCYTAMQYGGSSYKNIYRESNVHSYLNGSFIDLLDSNVRNMIKQVKIPYAYYDYTTMVHGTLSKGLSVKVFLLASEEVGYTSSSASELGVELSYFSNSTNAKRIAMYNGSAIQWYSRTPYKSASSNDYVVGFTTSGGGNTTMKYNTHAGIRPAMVLPLTAHVDENFNIIP